MYRERLHNSLKTANGRDSGVQDIEVEGVGVRGRGIRCLYSCEKLRKKTPVKLFLKDLDLKRKRKGNKENIISLLLILGLCTCEFVGLALITPNVKLT